METDSSPEVIAEPPETPVTDAEVSTETPVAAKLTPAEREQQFRDRTLYCLQEIIAPYQDGSALGVGVTLGTRTDS